MALSFFTFHFHSSVAFIIHIQALSSNFLLFAPQIISLIHSFLTFIGACRRVDTNVVIPLTVIPFPPYFHVLPALVLSGVQLYLSVLTRAWGFHMSFAIMEGA